MNSTAIKKPSFEKDMSLEKKFSRTIKSIIGNQFIVKDEIQDLEQGTDFMVLDLKPVKIAVRLRRHPEPGREYYFDEFTIRWWRPSGVDTEIDKIRKGFVDYMLYGFLTKDETKIIRYFISDLKIFREFEPKPICVLPNNPRDSDLAAYRINQFPKEFRIKIWP